MRKSLIIENGNKIVNVSYKDGKNGHIITVNELAKRFKGESRDWKRLFFTALLTKGIAFSSFGKYELKSK